MRKIRGDKEEEEQNKKDDDNDKRAVQRPFLKTDSPRYVIKLTHVCPNLVPHYPLQVHT
jgi:hypothetical protein